MVHHFMVIRATLFCLVFAISLTGLSRAADAPLDLKQSSLKFTGHAFLHDFDGAAKDFQGSAQIDPAQPTLVRGAHLDFPAAGMTTFEDTRDGNMRDWLHVGTHPEIEFQLTTVLPLKGDPAKATRDNPAQFTVRGTLTLNGTTRPLETTAAGWREGNALVVTGTTRIDTTAYGLPIIKQLFLTVDKEVDIAFHLVFDLPPGLQVQPAPRASA
jgi:polyisoprenoid-binding protein YceI